MIALSENQLLVDKFPPTDPHNVVARILRRGLGVISFGQLEGYFSARLEELSSDLTSSRVSYSAFGESLKRFITVEAALGLANRLGFIEKSDRLPFAERQISALAGFLETPPKYTSLGFSPKGSNVSESDLSSIILALGRKNAWSTLAQITGEIGATRVSLRDDYLNSHKLRNRSAHDSSTDIASSDLGNHLKTTIIIGIAFDILTSSIIQLYQNNNNPRVIQSKIENATWQYRFLDQQQDGSWAERTSSNGRIIKKYRDENTARTGANNRADSRFIVLRNQQQTPIELL